MGNYTKRNSEILLKPAFDFNQFIISVVLFGVSIKASTYHSASLSVPPCCLIILMLFEFDNLVLFV